ncbi:MAG: LLM class flavin-dependent oxidoreductase [Acidiferrobacteraceae bacterium]
MHFDLFYELSCPPFLKRTEAETFLETLGELEVAERSGFRTAWVAEHHFLREYSHSSAPDLFLAAASQRTRTLRLGHAIVPLPYHHPVHIAERAATLDLLSGGRLEFGFGRGFSPDEYAAFGVDMAESRSRTEETLSVLRQAFAGGCVSIEGRHFTLKALDVLPNALQRPHPPFWMASVSPDSFALAATLGVGVLAGPFKPWFMVRHDLARYRETWAASRPRIGSPRTAMTIGIVCLEDGKRAREVAEQVFPWFYRELLSHTAPVLEHLYETYDYYRKVGHIRTLLSRVVSLPVLEQMGMVVCGDPEHCKRKIRGYARCGLDHLLCAVAAGAAPTALVRESIETIGRHLIPHFR